MTRSDILKARLFGLGQCLFLIVDLFGCFLLSIATGLWAVLTKQEGAAPCFTETMSARAGRALLNRKPWARVTVPVIDLIFCWQEPTVDLPGGRSFTHRSHSLRAYVKTREGAYLPREYHSPLPPAVQACYRNHDA
jgi:hypothetical protein